MVKNLTKINIFKRFKIIIIVQILIFMTYFISNVLYANIQVASLSSFFIILGSFFAHNKMVKSQIVEKNFNDDPHELYDEDPMNESEVLDLKQIVKEERAKINILDQKSIKEGAKAGFSVFRLLPYLFLILGFIALKNNNILEIGIYLPSILLGIVVASFSVKKF